MPRAKRVCAQPGCPELTDGRRCTAHTREQDKARGRRQARGYDRQHDRLRAWWKPKVDRGQVDCAAPTCVMARRRILPGELWDLGHTEDRTTWRGPEHMSCNRGWRRAQ